MQQASYEILSLSQLASGHEESWCKLWESSLAKKISRDYYLKYGHDGEDLFQKVMMEFFQTARRYVIIDSKELPVYGVLKTIACRVEADFIAKKKRRYRIAKFVSWQATDNDGSEVDIEVLGIKQNGLGVKWEEELLEQDENRSMLSSILEALDREVITAEQWKLLEMSYVENKSDKVIAQELGENINTIKSRRQRAQKKLRKSLQTQAS